MYGLSIIDYNTMSYQRISSTASVPKLNPAVNGSAKVNSFESNLQQNQCQTDYDNVDEKANIYHETKVVINDETTKKEVKNVNKSDLFVDEEYNQNVADSQTAADNRDENQECNCFECEIRRNSNFSTEQLPLDIQMPLTLMSDSLMFCTIL
ncbi:unnamed protein product [Medioppia subpectinata]|uniref:Uncharacterized protein n=1 Tax=Medioppia subpectinata TaxID=1979941 RepID=A0A7R9KH46_9ACAR|nr:unnamed protein product [Medioppia subpectinata]CAG2102526.1 unnamed protein product [Medioppia subpectinata]